MAALREVRTELRVKATKADHQNEFPAELLPLCDKKDSHKVKSSRLVVNLVNKIITFYLSSSAHISCMFPFHLTEVVR